MRLDFIKGYFDVREYNAKKPRAERTIKGNDTTITFDVLYAAEELPECVAKHARAYEKNGEQRYCVKFKVSSGTKFFEKKNGNVVAIDRPDNTELDGKRFECCIDFRELNGDPTKMEACGYWVNGLLIKEDTGTMFDDLNENEAADVVIENNDEPDGLAF